MSSFIPVPKKIFFNTLIIMITCVTIGQGQTDGKFPGIQFPDQYDKTRPPMTINGDAVVVDFKVAVRTVSPIQSSEMEFRINMRLTMEWIEGRLSWDLSGQDNSYRIAPSGLKNLLWLTDPYIVNAKYTGVKKFEDKLDNILLLEDNRLSYTLILNATVACDMNFAFYPLDVQLCPMILQSFSYDVSRVIFQWSDDNCDGDIGESSFVRPIRMIQFEVVDPPKPVRRFVTVFQQGFFRDKCRLSIWFMIIRLHDYLQIKMMVMIMCYPPYKAFYLSGNVSQLVATFRFERLVVSHLVQSFIPCSLVVILTWFSFWLELDVTPARGYLLMVSILVHLGGLKTEFPPVAYIKAVDIWIFGCIFWIFCALTQFVLVKVIYSKIHEKIKENQVKTFDDSTTAPIRYFDVVGQLISAFRGSEHTNSLEPLTNPYTRFWLWQELQYLNNLDDHSPEQNKISPYIMTYQKARLGSCVLSDRSVATSKLPLVEKSICCGRTTLPMVYKSRRDNVLSSSSSKMVETRRVLWREIDNLSKVIFPISFVGFVIVYWSILAYHSFLI